MASFAEIFTGGDNNDYTQQKNNKNKYTHNNISTHQTLGALARAQTRHNNATNQLFRRMRGVGSPSCHHLEHGNKAKDAIEICKDTMHPRHTTKDQPTRTTPQQQHMATTTQDTQ